jgi:uncharacterized protein (TIGR03086 family)
MEPLEALARSRTEFQHRVAAVTADQWNLPTPCDDWDVRRLVEHVVRGNHMSITLLGGATPDEAMAAAMGAQLGTDLAAALATTVEPLEAGFGTATFDDVVHHPAGDMPLRRFLGFRIADYALHAWDLARAIGADESLDADLVVLVYEDMLPRAPVLDRTGHFGSGPRTSAADQTVQDRLLRLSGREP